MGNSEKADASDVNRLRQMAARNPEKPVQQQPDLPYKNPYDPRNNERNEPRPEERGEPKVGAPQPAAPGQPLPPVQPKTKLRSPLLAQDDFDENEEEEQYQSAAPQAPQGRGLHSPLLGAAGNNPRSPGRNRDAEDDYDQPTGGGAKFRSPLLGGGSGGEAQEIDRRRQSSQPFPGQERRGSGLRSPILGGAGVDDYYDQDDYYEDDEPVDEDNPNVLRSPLLSSKRPVDRPNVRKPQGSNAQTQNSNTEPVEPRYRTPQQSSPSTSYSNLRNINAPTGTAPDAVPPAPELQAPISAPESVAPQQPAPNAGYSTSPPSEYQFGVKPTQAPGWAQNPAQEMQAPWPQSVPLANIGDSQPSHSPNPLPAGGSNPTLPTTVLPPSSGRQDLSPQSDTISSVNAKGIQNSGEAESVMKPKGRPRMLSSAEDDSQEEESNYEPSRRGNYVPPAAATSPIPKMVGGVAVVLMLVEGSAFMGLMSEPNWRVSFIVMHYAVTFLTLVLIAVLGFTSKR